MPVPRDRDDDPYFSPLRDLNLKSGTELYLGLIHLTDGIEGAKRRAAAAKRVIPDFGVATECGFGRRPPETIPDLLRLHRAVQSRYRSKLFQLDERTRRRRAAPKHIKGGSNDCIGGNMLRILGATLVVGFSLVSQASAQSGNPIRIGMSSALTGAGASPAKVINTALKIWRDDINAKGGLLGRPVER